ncbi:MAG: hypothetical protein M3Z46_11610 [Actinomycetota bacterium]|nr:hypothetical protein [Actinomycetota bacterium]
MTAFDAHAHVIVPELLPTPSPARHVDLDAILANRVRVRPDYPLDTADPDPVATVRAVRFDEAAHVAVLPGNTERELWRVAVAGAQRG